MRFVEAANGEAAWTKNRQPHLSSPRMIRISHPIIVNAIRLPFTIIFKILNTFCISGMAVKIDWQYLFIDNLNFIRIPFISMESPKAS